MPPTVFDELGMDDRTKEKGSGLVGTMKEVVKLGKEEEKMSQSSIADEDDEEGVYSTDATFELMAQLKDVLTISLVQGWQIFDDG
ncbi:hypothetical protein MPER_09359 [Moniliophthora perniciosa FA553]|nr:hypothetical protein MPER_09359 [Moniliophthora perniciosa FA553]